MLSARRLIDDLKITDPEIHFEALVPEDQRPDPEHDAVMTRAWPGLKPLIWIARADRDISADEMEVLLAFITERKGLAGQKYAETHWNKNRAITQIDAARPTLADAAGTIARMSPTGRELVMLKHYAETIMKAGGKSGERRYRQLFKA